MKYVGLFFIVLITIPTVFVVANTCSYFGEAAAVARQEFGPRELLRKYREFKHLHSSLSSHQASIEVTQNELKLIEETYPDRMEWPRDVRQDYAQTRSVLQGMKKRFNQGAAKYNAAMADFSYAFCNVGTLPEGATEPLPRQYITYLSN